MLWRDLSPFKRAVGEENVNWVLTKQEVDEAEINTADTNAVSYMEATAQEFENASTWTAFAMANLCSVQ